MQRQGKASMLLARSGVLKHPSGLSLRLPLLVPSFSSKGFPYHKDNGRSEIREVMTMMGEYLEHTMLVSAYDLHHGHVPSVESIAHLTELTFIDSGGYEISEVFDLSAVYSYGVRDPEWQIGQLLSIWSSWPDSSPAVLVNLDRKGLPVDEQIASARSSLEPYGNHLRAIILKPETAGQQYIKIGSVVGAVDELKYFDIVGFAERELGSSLLQRMESIARLRQAFDAEGLDAPIHVFGSLDPLSCCLFYSSGAQIFDGLTWLRYGYLDGCAIYVPNYGAVTLGVAERETKARTRSLVDNLYYLRKLEDDMRVFALSSDFSVLGPHAGVIERAYRILETRLTRGGA